MRIIRVIRAGSVSLALALPMVAAGGCDDSSKSSTTATETPAQAEARAKNIRDAYKANPPDTAKKSGASTEKK